MVTYKTNEPYYELKLSDIPENTLHVLSFEGEEEISRLFKYRIDLISKEPDLDPKDILNKKATFVMNRGDEDPLNTNGIISRFEQRGRTPNYVFYYAELVPKLWRMELTFQSVVYQNKNIEKLVTQVLKNAGFAGQDFEFNKLTGSYPDLEYIVQYQETDFNFINRRLEHYGIFLQSRQSASLHKRNLERISLQYASGYRTGQGEGLQPSNSHKKSFSGKSDR
jgi:type VI secretion system secreted protein VgrG